MAINAGTPAAGTSPTGTSPAGPRQLMRRAERREAILRAAAFAFAARGFAATSMEDVAAAGGVTKLIVYRHFESKEALYEAVLRRVVDRLVEEFGRGLDTRRGITAVGALLVVAREDPAAVTLLWRHAAREPQFAAHAEMFRERAFAFASALLGAAGVPRRLLRWAAETVVSYVFEAVLHWLEEGSPGRDDEFLDLMAASLPALAATFAGRPGAPRGGAT